jgi:hypothetical protein
MKNIYYLLFASLFITSCGPVTVIQSDSYQPAPAPVEEVSYQSFYDQLSPYGNWINYPGYGYVWSPNAGPDFQPYATNGNWIYTDAGWTWSSNYNWGWAPFHYGRWFYENGYGWMWVPGNEWAPAWVSWRSGGDYYGWAPMGPRVSVDVALSNYNPPANYWNFVPRHYMGNPGWHNYYVNQSQNVTIINNTTVINNYSGTNRSRYNYAPGPDPDEVRRYSGNNFTAVQLREANAPGERMNGSQYVIYHPRVNANPAARGDANGRPATPAPARYQSFNNARPSAPNPSNNQPANQRPAGTNQEYNQPNNNPQPSNNPRPEYSSDNRRPENQGYNQPVNPRPATTNPGNNQPNNNPQPSSNPRPPAPANNQPNNNPQPSSNPKPPAPANNQPNNFRPANQNQLNNHVNPAPASTQTAPANRPSQPPAAKPAQTTGRPANNHNPHTNPPVQGTPAPENKPDTKQTEKPKTRQAENPN